MLGIKAVLVFICEIPTPVIFPLFVLLKRTQPPGQTAGSPWSFERVDAPRSTFADDCFLTFIIQERLTAHKSRHTFMRHNSDDLEQRQHLYLISTLPRGTSTGFVERGWTVSHCLLRPLCDWGIGPMTF